MKVTWNFSDTWAKGIFAPKRQKSLPKSDAVSSTLEGILSLDPFGKSYKLPKRLESYEFMTFKYPKSR